MMNKTCFTTSNEVTMTALMIILYFAHSSSQCSNLFASNLFSFVKQLLHHSWQFPANFSPFLNVKITSLKIILKLILVPKKRTTYRKRALSKLTIRTVVLGVSYPQAIPGGMPTSTEA